MAKSCRAYPFTPDAADDHGIRRGARRSIETRRPRFWSRGGRRAFTSKGSGNFPAANATPGESLAACLARELREELAVEARVGDEMFTTTHAYPDRARGAAFLSLRAARRAAAAARSGDALGAARRAAALEFPPADAELIGARCWQTPAGLSRDSSKATRSGLATLASVAPWRCERLCRAASHERQRRRLRRGARSTDRPSSPARRNRDARSRARSAAASAGDHVLLVTRPISRSPLRIVVPGAGTSRPSISSPTSLRATRPCPRCSTRMMTSCPT